MLELSLARGCRNQNAGPYPGWLVAPRGLKKKKEVTFFWPSLSTNDNENSIKYHMGTLKYIKNVNQQ